MLAASGDLRLRQFPVWCGPRSGHPPDASVGNPRNAVVNQATIWLRSARVAAEHRRVETTLAEEARQRQALEAHAAALALLDQSLASLTSSGT